MPFSLGFWAAAGAAIRSAWSYINAPTALTNLGTIAYSPLTAGNWYLPMTDGSDDYYYSTDAASWTLGAMPAPANYNFFSSSTRIIAARSSTTTNGCAYTTNGTTWTQSNLSTSASIYDGLWDGTRFLLVTNATGTGGLMYSTTGATWTSIDVGNGGYSIAFDGTSTYVVLSALSTATHRINTTDPTSSAAWSNITLPSATNWRSIAYGNGVWVATKSGTGYATSTDGTTWTARSVNLQYQFTAGRTTFFNGKFYYLTDDAAGGAPYLFYVRSSTDGVTWTTELTDTVGEMLSINAWAASSSKIIGAGNSVTTSRLLQGA